MAQEVKDASQGITDRDAEIEVLKEMVKGVQLQLKSKDTDAQRLHIKIKRLEKAMEIREQSLQEAQAHAQRM